MTTHLVYAFATALTWAGYFFVAKLVMAIAALSDPRSRAAGGSSIALVLNGLGAGVALLLGEVLARSTGLAKGIQIPLVWFVMPGFAWLAVIAGIFMITRATQAFLAITELERDDRLRATGICAAIAVVAGMLYRSDPKAKIEVLTGGIPFSLGEAVGVAALAIAAVAAMAVANRKATSRGIAKGVAAQLSLLAGSVVFGLPFAFLVITSFKEDRDMSSPNGIVWIPKVQEKVPYLDPKRPLYTTTFRGQPVEGEVIERRPDGTVKVDVFKPLAIRGTTFDTQEASLQQIPREVDVVTVQIDGQTAKGWVINDTDDGRKLVRFVEPATLKGQERLLNASEVQPVRHVGLRVQNYSEALSFLPPETQGGIVYVRNTLIIVAFSVLGTLFSSSIVAYAFSRMRFPGRDFLFGALLSTMMLPAAVTMLPQFLIFRSLGWIDTLLPLWVPAFFGSAFNIFMLRQFFKQIPMELEDAAKIDGCTYARTFWSIMMPQIRPAMAVITVWTFVGSWNNFMGPLIYINSPENMPLSYALQLFQGDRAGEPGLLMAFATLTILPVLALFFFAQKYFIEGVTLSGLGGR